MWIAKKVNKALMMEIMKVKVIQTNQCGILEIKRLGLAEFAMIVNDHQAE